MNQNLTPIELFTHFDAVMHDEAVDADATARLEEAGKRLLDDDKRSAQLLIEIGTRIYPQLEAWTMDIFAELTMASLEIDAVNSADVDADPIWLYAVAAENVNRRIAA